MIIQTNIYICDFCGLIDSETEDQFLYADPMIEPLDGWKEIQVTKEYRKDPCEPKVLACPACKQRLEENPKDVFLWDSYSG